MREGATARGTMEKGKYVRVIEGKKVRGDDPIEYFFPTGVESIFRVQRGWWQLNFSKMKKFLKEKEKELALLSVGVERIGGP